VHRLDDIDLHILKELQRDSSRTNVELARAVGLSAPACLRRVRRLRQIGAIRGEMAVLDPRLVGPGLTVVVAVDELLALSGSAVVLVSDAVFVMVVLLAMP